MRGNEKFLGKGGVYILLQCERKKLYNMVKAGNLKTKRERGYGEEHFRPMHGQGERIPYVVDMPRNEEVEIGASEEKKPPHVNEEMSPVEILTVSKVTEQGNLSTLAYKVKCKWEDQVKKEVLKLKEEYEGDCTYDR